MTKIGKIEDLKWGSFSTKFCQNRKKNVDFLFKLLLDVQVFVKGFNFSC